jgi:hypothetical protein
MQLSASAQTVLVPGDVAIIGYNFKDPDQLSFIFLRDVEAGTVMFVTDCGYDAPAAAFRPGEGLLTYTAPVGGKKAGEVVTYPDDVGFVKQGVSGFFGLSADGDQLIIFQGSFLMPTFIYALNVYDGTWQSGANDNNTSSLPPGLIEGTTALAQTQIVNSRLNCTGVAIEQNLFLSQSADINRWDRSNTTRVSLPHITCNYSILGIELDGAPVDSVDSNRLIISSGYVQIDVFELDGRFILSTAQFHEALSIINSEKMYIFKVYYPDRLEVRKIILNT